MSDALVELGHAANVNFMADATHFSADAAPISIDSTGSLEQHLDELDASQKLTWQPYGRTLLLWSAPDLRQFAQYIVAGDSIKLVAPEWPETAGISKPQGNGGRPLPGKGDAPPAPSKEKLLFEEISDYFRDTRGWDSHKPGSVSEVRISDLPPALHDKVVVAVQSSLLRPESQVIWKAWFNDDFWKVAELKLVEEDNGVLNGPKIPVLTVGGMMRIGNGTGGSMISLGELKSKPKN